ncbi:putative enzyme related to lactoylglutathione lyase [Arthrobacter sp. V4I6]|uniref:VOC family protein n=1 Tax=unclassified Arthrobacter TaxID=235627 RepID=UPI00278824DB|nr:MULTISPECIES: VOC family protein [unclassified Arthrobacter]MDQ0822759.1 putative enzyme related to lactoylglutathione lyase [Arthrobacter sp. V1I7]MDQ0852387.1 putative enzyme related to lactoylglutathione lyase [Arthrobacter sp. V4I6]
MPTPDHSTGAPCWIDLMTSDTEKAKAFYGTLFGWTFQTGDEEKYGGYITAAKDGKTVAGMMQKDDAMAGMPDTWSTYLGSDDAAATVQAAVQHGGQIYLEPMDVPEQGRMAMIADATGASVGIWEPHEMPGYGLAAEPGTPAWHELHATDYDKAVKFYQDVFGWNTDVMSDTPEFRYTTLGAGDSAKPGIMDASGYLPAEVPASWQIYFNVHDTDASIEKAVAMGATVIDGPDNTPFGRLATLADPTGAMFKIMADTTQDSADARPQSS